LPMPRITPPRRARPSATALAVALAVGALAVGVLGFTLTGRDGERVKSEDLPAAVPTTPSAVLSSDTSTATSVARAPTAAPAPAATTMKTPAQHERLSSASRLSLDGLGPVDIGMTLEEAS